MDSALPDPAAVTGLSLTDAATRLATVGPSALPRTKRRSPLRMILNV